MAIQSSPDLRTPQAFYNDLNKEFHFTLDPAATPASAKCKKFYTQEDDGLAKSWEGERVFCNPPGDDLPAWVQKCAEEGKKPDTTVVLLVPAKTDAAYFHEHILPNAEIRYLQGRLLQVDERGNKQSRPSHGLLLAIFRGPATQGTKAVIMDLLRAEPRCHTAREITEALRQQGHKYPINNISSRLSQLNRERKIRAVGRRACSITGKNAIEWRAVEGVS